MGKKLQDEIAAVVDDNGRVQASFSSPFAVQDAKGFLVDCKRGGVRHLTRAEVITGEAAKKAIEKGRA